MTRAISSLLIDCMLRGSVISLKVLLRNHFCCRVIFYSSLLLVLRRLYNDTHAAAQISMQRMTALCLSSSCLWTFLALGNLRNRQNSALISPFCSSTLAAPSQCISFGIWPGVEAYPLWPMSPSSSISETGCPSRALPRKFGFAEVEEVPGTRNSEYISSLGSRCNASSKAGPID